MSKKKLQILFYSLWFIGLLLQAIFTELIGDEAYYWMYSNKMAWGYFDHPPAIALFIKSGYFLIKSELGVRLLIITSSTIVIYLWEKIISPKRQIIFYMIVASVGILHFTGFLAIPDAPFMLSFTLFLIAYKNFIKQSNFKSTLLLSLSIAAMLYSKYHGVLVVILTVLSNIKLLKNKFLWIAGIITSTLMLPHILWQIQSDFPSVNYHFFERSTSAYKIDYTLEYLITQPFVLGPFIGIIFLISTFKTKSKNQFEKTLKFLFWGTYAFFLFMSFKGRVEAHWTLFAVFSGIYFSYNFVQENLKYEKLVKTSFWISLILILIGRIFVTLDFTTNRQLHKISKNYNHKNFIFAVNKVADTIPVAFINSYKLASLYQFYTGSPAFSLNNIMGRKNQFDIWKSEDVFRGKTVLGIPNYNLIGFDTLDYPQKITQYKIIDNFQSFSKVRINVIEAPQTAKLNDSILLNIFIEYNRNDVDFASNENYPSKIFYKYLSGKKQVKGGSIKKLENDMLNTYYEAKIPTPDAEGDYFLYISIKTGWLPETINGKYKELTVTK